MSEDISPSSSLMIFNYLLCFFSSLTRNLRLFCWSSPSLILCICLISNISLALWFVSYFPGLNGSNLFRCNWWNLDTWARLISFNFSATDFWGSSLILGCIKLGSWRISRVFVLKELVYVSCIDHLLIWECYKSLPLIGLIFRLVVGKEGNYSKCSISWLLPTLLGLIDKLWVS